MSSLDNYLAEDLQFRFLLYGPAYTKKTWWAGLAAEAGFNVLLFDCDGKAGILRNLSPEARKRVYVINITDESKRPVAKYFLEHFLSKDITYWDEKAKQVLVAPNKDCIVLDKLKFDKNWFVVLDSYTALVSSICLQYAIDQEIDLSDAKKADWDGFGWTGRLATYLIQEFKRSLSCHFAMIAHQIVWQRMKQTVVNGKLVQEVEFSRTQITSTSGPHAMGIPKEFTDTLRFFIQGSQFKIDVQAGDNIDGGTIYIEPKIYNWNDLNFKSICQLNNVPLPDKDLPLPIEFLKPSTESLNKVAEIQNRIKQTSRQEVQRANSSTTPIQANVTKPSFASLLNKP